VKPGAAGANAPHIAVSVLGRGLLNRLYTRLYFADEPANAADAVLALVPAARRSTLIASQETPGRWRFDVRLQGEGETVFFAV
jgi:protocatechuate 3,4-dioxygenase alpha subunit